MTHVLLISGHMGSGKDTFAEAVTQTLCQSSTARPDQVVTLHYADYLKFLCREYFGWSGEKDELGRRILQYVGTEVVREQDENFWVDLLIRLTKVFRGRWEWVLIPDTRFPNEIDRWKQTCGPDISVTSIRIARAGYEPDVSVTAQTHSSETSLDGYAFDYSIHNDGTYEDLREVAVNILCDIINEEENPWTI